MPSPPSPLPTLPPKKDDQQQPLQAVITNSRASPSHKPKRSIMTPPPPQLIQSKHLPQAADIRLCYSQTFLNQDRTDAYDQDVLTALQFSHDGNLIAVGDKGGRIQVYKRERDQGSCKYAPHVIFQSHNPDFDYLKSIEIEEKITQIKWLRSTGPANYLLSSNDRTIKLWKVGESRKRVWKALPNANRVNKLVIPRVMFTPSAPSSSLRKCFNNGHTFHINSLSVNSDEQTFASSDDLRINLWHTDRTDSSFVVVDLKPENMENLNEVITTCSFHPKSCNILCYGTSRGMTNLCDLRTSATCDTAFRHYREECGYRGFFTEVISSLSDAQFSNCGTCLVTRDFMSMRLWDTRMDSSSLLTIPVHDYLKPHLGTLYENDLIFDKFSVSWNHDSTRIVTGSYHDTFTVTEPNSGKSGYRSSLFQVAEDLKECRYLLRSKRVVGGGEEIENPLEEIKLEEMDLNKRVLLSQWHSKENLVATASCNQLCLFNEKVGLFR